MEIPKQDYQRSLSRMDQDEKLLAVIKRHPFGIIKLYVQLLVALVAIGGLIYFVLPGLFSSGDTNTNVYPMVGAAVAIVAGLILLIAFFATIIYGQNQLVVTNKTITQTLQISLFNKKISQLAVSSIEDVTADTDGLFQTLLNYGKLLVETAGEQENFHFDYCPHADHYAKLILETRQAFLSTRERERQESGERYLYNQQQASHGQQPYTQTMQSQQQMPQQPYAYGQVPPSPPPPIPQTLQNAAGDPAITGGTPTQPPQGPYTPN